MYCLYRLPLLFICSKRRVRTLGGYWLYPRKILEDSSCSLGGQVLEIVADWFIVFLLVAHRESLMITHSSCLLIILPSGFFQFQHIVRLHFFLFIMPKRKEFTPAGGSRKNPNSERKFNFAGGPGSMIQHVIITYNWRAGLSDQLDVESLYERVEDDF